MMEIIYLLIYITMEFLGCGLFYRIIFGVKITKNPIKILLAVCSTGLLHILVWYYLGIEDASGISIFSMLVVPAVLIEPRHKKYLFLYPFVALANSVIGVSASFLLAVLLDVPEYKIVEGNWYTILCQGVSVVVLVIGALCHKKVQKNEVFQVHLDWKQYVLLYIVVFCLFFMLAPMQGLTRMVGNSAYVNLIGVATSLACIVLVLVTIWQSVLVNRAIMLKERNEMNEKYMQLQKEYYAQLMQQDQQIRRFRHDMRGHMAVLKSYCKDKKIDQIESYLNMISEESAIDDLPGYTGNKGVDAVLRELLKISEQSGVEVTIKGTLAEVERILEYDLCTIFYNLMKNAIEACEKIEDTQERKIRIDMGNYNSQLFISIKNIVKEPVIIKGNHPHTTKRDKDHHGFGCENVERAVRKYQGTIEYSCENGWFDVEICM